MDVVAAVEEDAVRLAVLALDLTVSSEMTVAWDALAAEVAAREPDRPRWVWADTRAVYPHLLAAGGRVERCCDLRLSHVILAGSTYAPWDPDPTDARWRHAEPPADEEPSLMDLPGGGDDLGIDAVIAEHRRQQRAVRASDRADRLRLLLAAESAGALVAAELKHVGLPWDEQTHDQQLTAVLGTRPLPGGRPSRMEGLVVTIRDLLAQPGLNPDSQPDLLRALRAAGLAVESTRQHELESVVHPVVAPLLEYKKLHRLMTANGWAWMQTWVRGGRFRPDYLPGGVVTGRWATRGGGALQLPRQIRSAVVADPGHVLVVADASQLEPRVLAAMSGDEAMARASRRGDLYQALVDEGVVDTRGHAKVAMLGALYGATSGESGLLMPRLLRAYPDAVQTVEDAARKGERGGVVTTWLGRSSPPPSEAWREAQRRAAAPEADEAAQRLARRQARDWGRFTRNFVVQGTAAEWALCWLASLRRRLAAQADTTDAHLVYFLHDEVIVHARADSVGAVTDAVRGAAAEAGRLMFGTVGVEFVLDLQCVRDYGAAV